MAIVLAEVSIPYRTGLPRDVAINAMHWLTLDEPNTADFLAITAEIDAFWNLEIPEGEPGEGTRANIYLSPVVARGGSNPVRIRFYDAQADPKVPLAETNFALDAAPAGEILPFPNEVAICCSLTATPALAVPERRRRGRMYIGPLNGTYTQGAMDVAGVDLPAVSTACRESLAALCERMATGPTTVRWAIYSRAANQAYEVSGGFIDNEFDTQRRRQVDATARTTWGLPFP